jgi:hypothetical protein
MRRRVRGGGPVRAERVYRDQPTIISELRRRGYEFTTVRQYT